MGPLIKEEVFKHKITRSYRGTDGNAILNFSQPNYSKDIPVMNDSNNIPPGHKPIYENPVPIDNFLDDKLEVSNDMAKPRENPPKGPRQLVITHVVPAGTHMEHFPPKAPVAVKKVLCLYEINARRLDGKRFVRNRKWTFSMDDRAKMKLDLAGMGVDTTKKFTLTSLVGVNGMVNIMHEPDPKGGIKVKEGPLQSLLEGMPPITSESDPKVLPEWAQAYIAESAEYVQKFGKGPVGPYADAIKKAEDRKAGIRPGSGTQAPTDRGAPPPQEEDDLPF